MLETRSLSFAYHEETSFNFPDISLQAGENLLILGESGIGKTTLLHLMAGLLKPFSGTVKLFETSLFQLSLPKLDLFRGQHIGLVFQRPHFTKALTLHQNLNLVQYLSGRPQDHERIKQVTANLGIQSKLSRKPHQLSQGEQQRAAIAMAVANNPQLILADEPTSSLDEKNCMKVCDLLKEQASETNAMLVIITHDKRLQSHFHNQLSLS